MAERDVERTVTREQFITTLRRCADALEAGGSFRIQVLDERFTIPKDAHLSIEHEVEDGEAELEMQLKWSVPEE
jgi:amphi-Trp domain-containing protein